MGGTPFRSSFLLVLMAVTMTIQTVMTDDMPEAITCTAFTTRYDSTIVCDFGVDISKTKHNFNVYFYYPDLSANPEQTLVCNFILPRGVQCHSADGVFFNHVISDKIRVSRGPTRDKVGGLYVCQLVPLLENVPIETCNLTYQETPDIVQFSSPLPGQDEEENGEETRLLTVCVVFIVLLTAFVLIASMVICVFRERIRSWCTGNPKTEEMKDKEVKMEEIHSGKEEISPMVIDAPRTEQATMD